MNSEIARAVAAFGFVVLPGHDPTDSTHSALAKIGRIIRNPGFETVQRLIAHVKTDAPPNTYGGHYGYDALPLHSDLAHWFLPPRYVALRCVRGAESVTTNLLDSAQVVKDIGVNVMRRALVRPRRPVAGRRQLLHILEPQGDTGASIMRWDQLFLLPATAASAHVLDAMQSRIDGAAPIGILLGDPGDTLIIDNWRMLHGRSAISACDDRIIERTYMGELT